MFYPPARFLGGNVSTRVSNFSPPALLPEAAPPVWCMRLQAGSDRRKIRIGYNRAA